MKFTAKQIAQILDGEIEGSPEEEVSRLSKIEEGTKGSLTFLSNPKYNSYLYTTQASSMRSITCKSIIISLHDSIS